MLSYDQYVSLTPNDQYYDFAIVHVPSLYVYGQADTWRATVPETELSDSELLRLAEATGQFDFLNDPAEDVYSPNDGEPV